MNQNKTNKILIHFDTREVTTYSMEAQSLKVLDKSNINLDKNSSIDTIATAVSDFLARLSNQIDFTDISRVKVYATGIYQTLQPEDQDTLIIRVFVNSGLYLYIIPPDLEQFYLDTSRAKLGDANMMQGLITQEFRSVVVAGSIQNHLEKIGKVIEQLQHRHVAVLFPTTTNVVPETLGTDFLLLEGQHLKNRRDGWRLQYNQMQLYKKADAVIVCNPAGKTGQGVVFEFGFMVANRKRIIFTEQPLNLSVVFPYEVGLGF